MSLFSGLITINIGDSFEPNAGVKAIKLALRRSTRTQLYDLPQKLIEEFRPYLVSRKVRFFFPAGVNKPEWLDSQTEHLFHRIQINYYGRNMYVGGLNLTSQSFDIIWHRGKVYEISRVRLSKCLRCSLRQKVRQMETRRDVRMGSVFSREAWNEVISSELKCSAGGGFIVNLPLRVIQGFWPLISERDFRLLLPPGTDIVPNLVAKHRQRILPGLVKLQSEVYGRRVNCGGICLPHIHLSIAWDKGGLVSVRTFEWPECIECLKQTYETAWHLCWQF